METDPRLVLVLAMADDELIIGHRHAQWTGWAPHIEEDLAFSSIAQDEMAHARLLYQLARESGLTDRDEDALGFGREPDAYRNAILCERPNGDWGYSIARQYLYDTADAVRLAALRGSSWRELADLATLMQLEEAYHLDHARTWFERLAGGPVTARQRLADGLSACVGEALALFEPLPGEADLLAAGIMTTANEALLEAWLGRLGEDLEAASLDFVLERHRGLGDMVPTGSGEIAEAEAFTAPGIVHRDDRWMHEGGFAGAGGRTGRHGADFEPLWDEMTGMYRAHPGARW